MPESLDALVDLTYSELAGLARKVRTIDWRNRHQTTSLVHEAYIRMRRSGRLQIENPTHFLRVAALAMRQFLVDSARRSAAARRGGDRQDEPLCDVAAPDTELSADLLDFDEALTELHRIDERKGRIVALRFFGGCTLDQIAAVLETSLATVRRDWDFAKAWIADRLGPEAADDSSSKTAER